MHFCSVCSNMYYITIADTNELMYYCRKCGHQDASIEVNTSTMTVSKITTKVDKSYGHIINRYTKYDPTLPRINTIQCPNEECDTNKAVANSSASCSSVDREIIYIRYDDINMKYVYLCTCCDTVWKITDSS